jgi:signal transduction histidine kinase
MMPGMSGDELVAALRSRSEFDAVPILCLTARADDALRISLLKSGAQDYLTKPFLGQELLARAGNLIAMKRAGDALRSELVSASGDVEGLAKQLARAHRRLQTALDAAEVAREQAEQADRVKTHFLGMISHELRTPLATILLNTQLLAHPKHGELPQSCKPWLERLTRAARQISTLIEELLEFTRIESGVLVLQPQMVDPAELVQEVVDVQADYAAPSVVLRLAASTSKPQPFLSDARLLRVVLTNLVSNALKFTERGTVTIRQYPKDDEQIFEIRDTGMGIPDADLERIFLPFEQLEPIHQKSRPGIGLGLALVRRHCRGCQ